MKFYIRSHIYKIIINILILLIPGYYLITTILHENDKYLPMPNPVTKSYAVTVIVNFGGMLIYYLVDLVLSEKKMTLGKWLLIVFYSGMLISGLITFMVCKSYGL
ncbi:hypothetical protein [Lactiplantibacillus plantarum]|uniref:hypothetical protein n=1 Tax=Lactiplantibacillus plantarum TaxID=1590 RepID=UPI00077E1541|nr:hypothetical protein [Lactiplantibacillus plantarum]AMR18570.1 hypothetical protein AZF39_00567 [Lactiplantibacillus plantarum]MDB7771001.1 hypothetical protein [Lactiplantibacillus plantarum]MDN7027312.1 hypothetical protein [Lactiplantibacillus plantarum]QIA85652.1 hypothetical protein FEE41_10705 [Lactiplantibacillus plantarum]QTL11170.1 hypothetical protein J7V10_11975 [Lactiplantibacillus plantarum]